MFGLKLGLESCVLRHACRIIFTSQIQLKTAKSLHVSGVVVPHGSRSVFSALALLCIPESLTAAGPARRGTDSV